MCTLSLLCCKSADRLVPRLAFNRDESHNRAIGLRPQLREFAGHKALLPIDPQSGGTWLGVNDCGVALAILNVNLAEPCTRQPTHSRGQLIPRLLGMTSARAATEAAGALDLTAYVPFRLVAVSATTCFSLRWDGSAAERQSHQPSDWPLLYTSSGLGDHIVEPPRRAVFHTVEDAPSQDAFHDFSWAQDTPRSVRMYREDARTVSRTVIVWKPQEIVMQYDPLDGPVSVHRLKLRNARSRTQ